MTKGDDAEDQLIKEFKAFIAPRFKRILLDTYIFDRRDYFYLEHYILPEIFGEFETVKRIDDLWKQLEFRKRARAILEEKFDSVSEEEHSAWREEEINAEWSNIEPIVMKHIQTLAAKYRRGQDIDDYGCDLDLGWNKECLYFYDKVIPHDKIRYLNFSNFAVRLRECINSRQDTAVSKWSPVGPKNGPDFEVHVKEQLEQLGWVVRRSGRTGDQGADLIARKGTRTVVIQCKCYSNPVGNKAIQEAHAGKGYHRADAAAVVSNAPFTQSARQLARSLGVAILDLQCLDRLDASTASE